MSKPAFEGLYRLTFDEYHYRAYALATVAKAFKDATAVLMDQAPPEDWQMLERLLDQQIEDIEDFILGADIETLTDIIERTQAAFDAQESEC